MKYYIYIDSGKPSTPRTLGLSTSLRASSVSMFTSFKVYPVLVQTIRISDRGTIRKSFTKNRLTHLDPEVETRSKGLGNEKGNLECLLMTDSIPGFCH